jgi:hypothetical protein
VSVTKPVPVSVQVSMSVLASMFIIMCIFIFVFTKHGHELIIKIFRDINMIVIGKVYSYFETDKNTDMDMDIDMKMRLVASSLQNMDRFRY